MYEKNHNKTVLQTINELEKSQKLELTFQDFFDLMSFKNEFTNCREDLKLIFNLFDKNASGKISVQDLKKLSLELEETISENELMEMIKYADSNHDGFVSFDDFYNIINLQTL